MSANPGYNVPSIPQDTVHLAIHLPAPAATSLPLATALASQIASLIEQLLPTEWIWHRDTLELNVVEEARVQPVTNRGSAASDQSSDKKFRLGATVRVGDSIEDEWVAVWLLKEITTKWDGLVASIYDSDGDFLLIEAAHVLPNWVTPSNSENRVWISNGSLHLIPLSVSSPLSSRPPKRDRRLTNADSDYEDEDDGGPTADERAVGWVELNKAVEEVRAGRWRDRKVEQAVWERISGYPDALKDHQHRATMYLPTPIALALARQPSLIQKAVETFYTRDPTQLRKAARMSHFPPADSTLTQVTMTRTAYAQLKGQEFFPSKAFGSEWTDALTGDVSTADRAAEKEYRDRGVKVAVGFEILCGESKARTKTYPGLDVSDEAGQVRLDALKRQEDFRTYLDTLKKAGWFGEKEIEGSERWKLRERDAAAGWIKLGKLVEDDSSRPSFATLFSSALSLSGPSDASELAPSKPDDSEDWLEVDPAQLDTLMQERSSGRAPDTEDKKYLPEEEDIDMNLLVSGSEAEGVRKLEELARKVGSFVDGQGRLEGAIFDDETLSDGDEIDSDADDAQLEKDMAADLDDLSSSDEEGKDPSLTSAQRATRMANLIEPLSPSEWGIKTQKPSASSSEQSNETLTSSFATPISNVEHSIPVSAKSRTLEETDRQRKLREIKDDQARKLPPVKMRRPILPKDSYDGVDSDDESDDQDGFNEMYGGNAGISADLKEAIGVDTAADGVMDDVDEDKNEDLPQVLGEMEVDMGEEEEDFLKFARDALGLDERMWASILEDREKRGAFVPTPKPTKADPPTENAAGLKSASLSSKPVSSSKLAPNKANAQSFSTSTSTSTSKAVRFEDILPNESPVSSAQPKSSTDMPLRERRDKPKPEVLPGAIPDQSLNSFEAVMQKMDEELMRRKSGQGDSLSSVTASMPSSKSKVESKSRPRTNGISNKNSFSSSSSPKASTKSNENKAPSFDFLTASDKPPKNTPVMGIDSDGDIDDAGSDFDPDDPMLAMDAELRAALLAAGDLGSDDEAEAEGLEGDDKIDYNLIKHFLESYKSQGGMAGPVGNLLGRLKQ